MPAFLDTGDTATLTALRSFLTGVLPANVEVVRAQVNRVPQPQGVDHVVMTPLRRTRLETNTDTVEDVTATASIDGTVMTVTATAGGALGPGSGVTGAGVAAGTLIVSYGSATGGNGTYNVAPAQTLPPGQVFGGRKRLLQSVRVDVQLDIHGPSSADNAQIVTTLFRDEYATTVFGADVQPLYAEEPRQLPFVNAEAQYEDRWIVEVCLQANQTVTIPQEFADTIDVGLVPVDEFYPVS